MRGTSLKFHQAQALAPHDRTGDDTGHLFGRHHLALLAGRLALLRAVGRKCRKAHVRSRKARTSDHHVHALLAILDTDRLQKARHRILRSRVTGTARQPVNSGNRRHAHDRTVHPLDIGMQKYSHLPQLEVGILFSPEICFRLNGIFTCRTTGKKYTGAYNIRQTEDGYLLSQADHREPVSLPLTFEPEDDTTSDFDLTDVVIGIQFHWERKENQKFKGKLKIIDEQKHLTAINILSLEDYLLSVISSEMRATSSAEFLKAHAVISRSWLLAQIDKAKTVRGTYSSCRVDQEEYIRWYDREDHAHFDVCADDHCQRYQGISKAYTPAVREALEATRGEVLTYEGTICDARFSKCCGGATERFDNTCGFVGSGFRCHFGSGSPQEIAGESDFNRFIIGVYIKRLNVVSINKKTVF